MMCGSDLWLVIESHCAFLNVLGRDGNWRHSLGGNLWNFLCLIGECTTHMIVTSWLWYTWNLWLECLCLLLKLSETRVYFITLKLYVLFDRLLYQLIVIWNTCTGVVWTCIQRPLLLTLNSTPLVVNWIEAATMRKLTSHGTVYVEFLSMRLSILVYSSITIFELIGVRTR